MAHQEEQKIFEAYLRDNNLKHTEQRARILNIFLNSERHLTTEELYTVVRRKYPTIGYATLCRTMKLLGQAGLCKELTLDDRVTRYERLHGDDHHDHLICIKCGAFEEIVDQEIERLQEKVAKENEFTLVRHKLELYGICKQCKQ